MTRLATLSSELDRRLRAASPERRTAVVQRACSAAAETQSNLEPTLERALASLGSGGQVPPTLAAELSALVEKYDEEYFSLQELADEGQAEEGAWQRPFSLARLASALSFAASPSDFDSAAEAIYEASMVLEDSSTLVADLERMTA